MIGLTVLYRPVGPDELSFISKSGYRAFPPRPPTQPVFYPVMNEEYATQIARDWNVKDSGVGYVTRFSVPSEYLRRYSVQTVGSSLHEEVCVLAEDLEDFNRHISGKIEVIASFGAAAAR